jgi:hypothetical protein
MRAMCAYITHTSGLDDVSPYTAYTIQLVSNDGGTIAVLLPNPHASTSLLLD